MKKFLLSIWYTILFQFDNHRNDIPEWWYEDKPFEYKPYWIQRTIIAQDVIDQVTVYRYNALRGSYITKFVATDMDYLDNVKEKFEKIRTCAVCALGACFMSAVKFKNSFTFKEIADISTTAIFTGNDKVEKILSIFTSNQLLLIEAAFEKRDCSFFANYLKSPADTTYEERCKAYEFGDNFNDDNDRLVAIMQNIIDNKGEFKP